MPTQRIDNSGWGHPGSEFLRDSKVIHGRDVATFSGRFVYNEIEMVFSACEQTSGRYILRGTISAISPLDDRVLQVVGRERSVLLDHLVQNGNYQNREEATRRRNKALNVSYPIYGRELNEESVKAAIENAAEKLFAKNAPLLQRVLRQSSRPDNITPNVAFAAYVDDFLSSQFSNASGKSRANYRSRLAKLLRKLPNSPMSKVKPSEVAACIKRLDCNKSEIQRAYLFWQFLLDHSYCTGNNPVPSNAKRRESAETRQQQSRRPDCLDMAQQDALFDALIAGEVSGADCGIALMAWGGIGLKRVLTWGSVHFDSVDPTLVVVDIHQPDLAGATHDYSRPVAPFCALILRKRYQALIGKYTAEEVLGAPVVSLKMNAQKARSHEAFLGDATRALRAVAPDIMAGSKKKGGTAAAKRVLQNTYVNNVYTRLGFQDDAGTTAFLCGERLKDVTSDSYSKFNDLDGIARIHASEMILSPLAEINTTEQMEYLTDGRIKYTLLPDNTRKTVGVGCDIILPPGGEVVLLCRHGVEVVLAPREVKADGRVRRKSSKRAKAYKPETVNGEDTERLQETEPKLTEETPVSSAQRESANQEQSASSADEYSIPPPLKNIVVPHIEVKQHGPKKETLLPGQSSFFND